MMADVFDMLAAEHRHLERVLDELAEGDHRSGRNVVVARFNSVLCAHLAFEEVALHPLLRPYSDDLADAAASEQDLALHRLTALNLAITASSADAVVAAVATLRAVIVSHGNNDERHRFPQLRAIYDQPTIDSLGERLNTMRQQIDTGP
jgi:Hemerythrin HHE cation binding domain